MSSLQISVDNPNETRAHISIVRHQVNQTVVKHQPNQTVVQIVQQPEITDQSKPQDSQNAKTQQVKQQDTNNLYIKLKIKFFEWSMLKRVLIVSFLIALILTGPIIAIIVMTRPHPPPAWTQNHTILLDFQDGQVHVTPTHTYNGEDSARHISHVVHHTHNKSQSVELELHSTVHLASHDKDTKEKIYEFTVPLFQIFQILTNSNKTSENFVEWLSQFSKDSTAFIDQFMHILKQRMQKHKHSQHHNSTHPAAILQILNYTSKILIDVEYQPKLGNFSVLSYIESESSQYKIEDKVEKETNETRTARVSRFLAIAAAELHRITHGNHHNLKSLKPEAWKNHRNFVQQKPEDLTAPWQHVLLHKCRTIKSFTFRCQLETVKTLVPDIDLEKLEEKYSVIHVLVFRVKETELKTQ